MDAVSPIGVFSMSTIGRAAAICCLTASVMAADGFGIVRATLLSSVNTSSSVRRRGPCGGSPLSATGARPPPYVFGSASRRIPPTHP